MDDGTHTHIAHSSFKSSVMVCDSLFNGVSFSSKEASTSIKKLMCAVLFSKRRRVSSSFRRIFSIARTMLTESSPRVPIPAANNPTRIAAPPHIAPAIMASITGTHSMMAVPRTYYKLRRPLVKNRERGCDARAARASRWKSVSQIGWERPTWHAPSPAPPRLQSTCNSPSVSPQTP